MARSPGRPWFRLGVKAVATPGLWLLSVGLGVGGGCQEWEPGALLSVALQISGTLRDQVLNLQDFCLLNKGEGWDVKRERTLGFLSWFCHRLCDHGQAPPFFGSQFLYL